MARLFVSPWVLIGLSLALVSAGPGAEVKARRILFTLKHTLRPEKDKPLAQVRLTIQVPMDIPGLQDVTSLRYSVKPEKEFDENGDRYATFVFEGLDKPQEVEIDVDVDVFRYDLETAKSAKALCEANELVDRFRGAEKFLERDAPEIQDLLKTLSGKTDDEKIKGVMECVTATLDWSGYNPDEVGAVGALKQKKGDCTEFSDLFVALCRASGLPARVCEGYITTPVAAGDTQKHAWAEVYHAEYGWVPVDPMWVETRATALEKRNPVYILFTRERNHPPLSEGHFSAWTWTGGKLEVKDAYVIKSQSDLLAK